MLCNALHIYILPVYVMLHSTHLHIYIHTTSIYYMHIYYTLYAPAFLGSPLASAAAPHCCRGPAPAT